MSGAYKQPKKIKEVIELMQSRDWVLPNIQRKFLWDKNRICNLFDSLMRGYPIGTFMLWKVSKDNIYEFNFFSFLQNYKEKFYETCDDISLSATSNDLYAVIDGQQRLNSLYIGLMGSYAKKLPNKHWRKVYDERIQPKEYLYLNITEIMKSDDIGNTYNFAFFSEEKMKNMTDGTNWYKVGDILKIKSLNEEEFDEEDIFNPIVDEIISKQGIDASYTRVARKILKRLYKVIQLNLAIHYYQEDTQDLNKVVDIFVRSNSGGLPLSFSDLVMSVMVGKWKEAREKIDNLVKLIFAEYGLDVDRDFVLKNCLMIHSDNVRFRVSNFNDNFVNDTKLDFVKISKSISSTCNFIKQIGISNNVLRSKYVLIPIIYYVYKYDIEIDKMAKLKDDKKRIALWLKMALLKGMFGGQPDSILPKLRELINKSSKNNFPLKAIVEEYKNKSKDISIDEEFLEDKIKNSKYASAEAYLILSLITDLDPQHKYSVDHMYPKAFFSKSSLKEKYFLNNDEGLREFYENKENWNTVGNLQLLNGSENSSKNQSTLKNWLENNPQYDKKLYFIPKDGSDDKYIIEEYEFKKFLEKRQKLILQRLKNIFAL